MTFEKVVAKNRAFRNNTSFLQQFFQFRGGGERSLCSPPGGAYAIFSEFPKDSTKNFVSLTSCIRDRLKIKSHAQQIAIIAYLVIIFIFLDKARKL